MASEHGILRLTRVATIFALALPASIAQAQLRPVAPLDWGLLDGSSTWSAGLGVGMLEDQQASLAGTRGDLFELGNFHVGWRSGRIGLEVGGTLIRRFSDQVVVRPPVAGADPPNGTTRHDAGDVVASTAIRLSREQQQLQFALRFGTRLPTPSNEPGLDRDRTDFFSTIGARYLLGRFALSAESGLGILGTRVDGLDQLDVLTYSVGVETNFGAFATSGTIVGQDDVHRGTVRGNEDLSELRLRVRTGNRLWVSAMAIVGVAEFSPGRGFVLMAGVRR